MFWWLVGIESILSRIFWVILVPRKLHIGKWENRLKFGSKYRKIPNVFWCLQIFWITMRCIKSKVVQRNWMSHLCVRTAMSTMCFANFVNFWKQYQRFVQKSFWISQRWNNECFEKKNLTSLETVKYFVSI